MDQNETFRSRLAEAGKGISALCVRRPVLTIVANMLIIVAGLAAFSGVEIRELPDVDRPVITIRADYEGATPETIDTQVTSELEGAAAQVPGVIAISSESSSGDARVVVEFDDSVDLNVAANDMRDAIGNVERRLPEEVEDLSVVKADDNSDAVMRLAVTSSTLGIAELTRLVQDDVVDRLSAVEGVADVQVYGDREPLVRVLIDPNALAVRGLTIADLAEQLDTVALDSPAGSLSDRNRSLIVRADASIKDPAQVENIRINRDTRIGDVADVIYGPAERASALRINGETGIGLGIVRQAQSNTLDISSGVQAAVERLNQTLPDGVDIRVTSDDATFIGGALNEVVFTLAIAIVIVVGVIYIFLRSWVSTLIPTVTVPIALVGTIAAVWAAGFSLNILTLLAFVLATGMVVDDAIVVLENIERHRKQGMGPRAAAVLGSRQVFFAVIATTATLAAVFIPISFFPGTAGRLFSEFGFTLAFAVLLSSFVALTLAPMLASRLLKPHDETASRNPLIRGIERIGSASERAYLGLLDKALAAPLIVILVCSLFAGAAAFTYTTLPEELTPPEDRGVILVAIRGPQSVTVDFMENQLRQVEQAAFPLIESGEVRNMFLIAGRGSANSGFTVLTLAPWEERERSQQEILAELQPKLQGIPGVQVFARSANSLGIRGGGQGLRFAVIGSDYGEIAEAADQLVARVETLPGFETVSLDYDTTQPQLSLAIDRDRASDIGVDIADLGTTLSTLLDGRDAGEFYIGSDAITVRAEAPEGIIDDPTDLEGIFVRTSGGRMVPLSSFVSVSESAVAPDLAREGQRRAVPVTASLDDGTDLRTAMEDMQAAADEVLPGTMNIQFLGEAAELNTASGGVMTTFAFAILVVLLVLAAQFESFISAVIIILTVPFGLAAAVFAILLTGGSLNIYSQIGLVMLVGLMAKNGILVVEFANQMREEGMSVLESVRSACRVRLRPVMMTMISTVVGGVPLILSGGAGAEARQSLGWIIVGGLGFATLFTMFLTPVAFLLLARFSKTRNAEEARLERELRETFRREEEAEPVPGLRVAAE